MHLGELSCEQVVPTLSHKGKEVVRNTADVNVEMGAPEELDAMTLDYPEDVLPPPTPVLKPSAPVWKAIDNWVYCKVSSLKTWFFEPLVKQVPSDGSSLTQDEMIQAAVKRVVTRMASLFTGPRKKMLEQDLWALVDGIIQGAFTDLEEQLHSPSEPPALFSSKSLLQFVNSLTVVNMTSALTRSAEHIKAENLQLKEQVSSHFKGDIQLLEVQQLRGAMEARDGEIEELKKKLAASEEARRVTAEESKSRDEELAQLRHFLNHLTDAAESISQVVSDQDILEFEDKMLKSSRDAQEARYLHKTAEVTIKEQDWVIKELRDSLIESHNLQLAAEALAQGRGVELSQFYSVYKELCCLLNIGDLPLEPVTTSTVTPMDTKSDSTPDSLSNFIPSLNTTSLPSTLVETHNTSPVVIFLSGHPNAYFVCTGEDPLTYLLVKKNEDELADPSLHMALTLQDIRELMEIERVEDLYAQELEEVFGIPFDIRAEHDKLIELSFD
ncbi:hypothetical protein GYMLUDRAFT_239436 [Collybiopsis luxurians FD-317 M1]|nr:hypothetical protein GYMLUDRAFT_239436 [Collybiopsis luxurians FD-317 M1]